MTCKWKDAIIDAAVVDWVYTKEMEDDPRLTVNSLLAWQAKLALDPAVSKEAHDLHQRIKDLEKTLELERNGGQGAIAAYHATLDALGAPPDEWPCNRVGQLVRQLRDENERLARLVKTYKHELSYYES